MMTSLFPQYVAEVITGPMPDPPGVKLQKEVLKVSVLLQQKKNSVSVRNESEETQEFPWWDDDVNGVKEAEVDRKSGDQNGNQIDDGAGVLYSLSKEKENTLLTLVVDSIGVKSSVEEGKPHEHELF
ncbi:PHD domain-containing protein [Abeliophyllum distichum]|uniref:PHD domain-containing protein n=1 Tax=Abeliophyllum distichum TaxID=126358 RepID=A0ABD1RUZ8_9LAMI